MAPPRPEGPAKNLAKVFAHGSPKDVEAILKTTNHNINEPITIGSASPFWPVQWTALIYACRNLNLEVVKLLLQKGADPNISSTGDFTPIMALTMSVIVTEQSIGIDCAKLLVDGGLAITNVPMCHRRTLLTQTVHKNLALLMEYFLQIGADPNVRDDHGYTPLNFAVNKNSMEMVEILRKHGTNPFLENLNGYSCLDIALNEDNKEMHAMLLSWRKSYYIEKFNKDKEKFLEMVKDVNADCVGYIRKPATSKSDLEKPKPDKVNKKEPVLPTVLEEVEDNENKNDVPTTKLTERENRNSSIANSREENVGLEYDDSFVHGMVEPSDDLANNLPIPESSSSPLPMFEDNSSSFSSPPPTPSDPDPNPGNEAERTEKPSKDSWIHNLALIVGTAVVTLMTYHLFRKFRTPDSK